MEIKKRIALLYLMIIFAFTALLIRLSYVKVAYSAEYYYRALDLWTRTAPVEGRRGNIYDRNGTLIVGSSLAPTVVTIPKQVKDKARTAKILANILECSESDIMNHLNKNVSVEIIKPSGRKISTEIAGRIAKEQLDGIYIVGDTIRNYPYNHYLAQVLGIVGIDGQGITGIEYIYDDYLKGNNGGVLIYTDAHGNTLADYSGFYQNATSGMDIYLTIDLGIQIALERVMDNAMSRYDATEMIGLVMNPKTAEVYAMASRPTFNPENYQDYSQELYNRNLTIWSSYEPGSTFKFVTFSGGLEEQVFSLDEKYYDPGYIMVDGARIKDWKAGGHGNETFLEVIQNSCNPGFVTIGLRLGKERLFKYIKAYGFGTKTGIDLLGESTGILFNLEKIGNVEVATTAFGQGISVTPIQLVTAASACINGGKLYKPYIVKGIGIDSNYIFENEPTFVQEVISEETSATMRYALESVVALGTGRSSYIEGYRVGGKTGVVSD